MTGILLTGLLLAWCLGLILLIGIFHRPVLAAWREPVLAAPVLVIESDDWGPGPDFQCRALRELTACLSAVRDNTGHPACMTLGLTLSVPDEEFLRETACREYRARWIDHPQFTCILNAVRGGIEAGCFSPQLHGSAHYWPSALLTAAQQDAGVRAWLEGSEHETERLPDHLQSRWTDASTLPSRALNAEAQLAAVAEEVTAYTRILDEPPAVVVPPTFLWNAEVEAAWAGQGVRCVITPGCRYTRRDAEGRPAGIDRRCHNAEIATGGIRYLVRDVYFEPVLGQRADDALAAMAERVALGRPCLLETHRFNFTDEHRHASLVELERLLTLARERFPGLRFLSSEQLDRYYRAGGGLHEPPGLSRLVVRLKRLLRIPRFGRLARFAGLGLSVRLLERARG